MKNETTKAGDLARASREGNEGRRTSCSFGASGHVVGNPGERREDASDENVDTLTSEPSLHTPPDTCHDSPYMLAWDQMGNLSDLRLKTGHRDP